MRLPFFGVPIVRGRLVGYAHPDRAGHRRRGHRASVPRPQPTVERPVRAVDNFPENCGQTTTAPYHEQPLSALQAFPWFHVKRPRRTCSQFVITRLRWRSGVDGGDRDRRRGDAPPASAADRFRGRRRGCDACGGFPASECGRYAEGLHTQRLGGGRAETAATDARPAARSHHRSPHRLAEHR